MWAHPREKGVDLFLFLDATLLLTLPNSSSTSPIKLQFPCLRILPPKTRPRWHAEGASEHTQRRPLPLARPAPLAPRPPAYGEESRPTPHAAGEPGRLAGPAPPETLLLCVPQPPALTTGTPDGSSRGQGGGAQTRRARRLSRPPALSPARPRASPGPPTTSVLRTLVDPAARPAWRMWG